MKLLNDIRKFLFAPSSDFKAGDSVELKSGGPLMIVTHVFCKRNMNQPLIHCKWYDRERKTTRTNLFLERDLRKFDWYKAIQFNEQKSFLNDLQVGRSQEA
jgi:uncharacterized protein YodC (DUF2158 family)